MTEQAAPPKPAAAFSAWELGLAVRYLRAKKKQGGIALISIISFIGIMLGVAVLIGTMSIMGGFRADLLGRIVGFNGHIFVQGAPIEHGDREAFLNRLRAIPGVTQVSPLLDNQAIIQGVGEPTGVIVRGMTPRALGETPLVLEHLEPKGAAKSFGQGEYGGELVLLGDRLAGTLNVKPGDSVVITSPSSGATALGSMPAQKTYTVGGTFSVGMAEYDQAFVFMPLEQAQLLFGKEGQWTAAEVKTTDPDHLDAVKALVANAAGPGAVVGDWRDRNLSFFNALEVERVAMRLIMMLIVLIAALNIISGLVMLVKNKGRDIAILRTMGASRGAVLRIFFMAGSLIGVMGTVAGVVLGVLFVVFISPIQSFLEWITGTHLFDPSVYFLTRIPARLEWDEIAFVVLWSLLASCGATFIPALRASQLDPVEALRYE